MIDIVLFILITMLVLVILAFLTSVFFMLIDDTLDLDLAGILVRKIKKTKLYNKLKSME